MSDLFQPLRYHRDVEFHKHTNRAVGWLELFYDLVYVATLIQIGNFLSSNLDWTGFGRFLVLMFVIWWAWSGETAYQNRYYVDDVIHRLLVLLQMIGVAVIGLSVSEAFGDLSTQFALAFAFVRSILVVMWCRSYRAHPASRTLAISYSTGIGVGALIWLASLALPEDLRWIAWLVAIAFEIVYFAKPTTMAETLRWLPDDHHLVERVGIFTIIVLGEAFVKILDDAQGTALGWNEITFAVVLVTGLFSLWWLHFSDSAGELYDLSTNVKPMAWLYGHLFLAVALVMFGVAAKKLFGETIEHPRDVVKQEYRLLLTVSLVVFLLGQSTITYGVDDALTTLSQKRRIVEYIGAAVVVAVLGVTLTSLTAIGITAIMTAVLLVLVGDAIIQTKQAPTH
ncbi:MAG: low temperature requirement protein A [Actinomycetota bacterium]